MMEGSTEGTGKPAATLRQDEHALGVSEGIWAVSDGRRVFAQAQPGLADGGCRSSVR